MIENKDKFYAPQWLVDEILRFIFQNLFKNNFPISEFYEPAAGDCAFHELINFDVPCHFYDKYVDDKVSDIVTQQDFLESKHTYKRGRIIVSGVPYSIFPKFTEKCVEIADYAILIVPAQQYNRNNYHKFELLFSELFIDIDFKNQNGKIKKKNSCLNVYKKRTNPIEGFGPLLNDLSITAADHRRKKKYEYYIGSRFKNTGILYKKQPIGSFMGVNILNENMRYKIENTLKNFNEKHINEINERSTNSNTIMNKYTFQQLLYNDLY